MNNRKVSIRVRYAVVITLLMGVLACLASPTNMPSTPGPDFQSTIDALNTQVADQAAGLTTEQNIAPTSILPMETDTPVPPSIIQPELIVSGGEHVRFHIDPYIREFNIYSQIPPECSFGVILYLDGAMYTILSADSAAYWPLNSNKSIWVPSDWVLGFSPLTVGDHIVQVEGCPTLRWEFWTIGTPPLEIVVNKDWRDFTYRFLVNEETDYLVSVKLTSGAFNLAVGSYGWDIYVSEEHTITLGAGLHYLRGAPLPPQNAAAEYSVSIRKP